MMNSISLLLFLACNKNKQDCESADPTAHLTRISMALRGTRPSLKELEKVQEDPSEIPELVDKYLKSDEFGAMVRRVHGEWLLTDMGKDYYPMNFPAVGDLAGVDVWEINSSIGQAPGRLAEYIVLNDRSYTELVTADYTLADGIVATVWGLPYSWLQGGWQVTEYDDGRKPAGILNDPWWFVRHASTETNKHRARAAHVARALLCHDYMNREVRIPEHVDLTDGGSDALNNNPVCVGCHQTLDPLAAFFVEHEGVIVPEATWNYPIQEYVANATPHVEPMFYGEPGEDLYDLGWMIAEDSRFARCTIRRFWGQMMTMPAEDVEHRVIDGYYSTFVDGGYQVKPLLKEMVLSEEFAVVDSTEENGAQGLRRAAPWQLESSLEDLTGVEWDTYIEYDLGGGTIGEVKLMDDVSWGWRTLAGGPDGYDKWDVTRTATPTTLFVLKKMAAIAAPQVVDADLNRWEGRLLTVGKRSGEEAIKEQIARLYLRMYGESHEADSEDVLGTWELFQAAGGTEEPEEAWTMVLYAMLQDPRILYY